MILDATHPLRWWSRQYQGGGRKDRTPLLRILRDKNGERTNVFTAENGPRTFEDDNQKKKNTKADMEMPGESAWTETEGISDGSDCRIITVENIQSAVDFLKTTEGPVFVTTGSKELSAFLALPDWETRIYARVLSMPEVVRPARYGLLRQPSDRNAGTLCGRLKCCNDESGPCEVDGDEGVRKGGRIRGKGQRGEKAGVGLVVIGRPVEEGISLEEGIAYLEEHFALGRSVKNSGKRQVFLIGTGPGSESYLTGEAKKRLDKCDLIVGASRCVRQLESFQQTCF